MNERFLLALTTIILLGYFVVRPVGAHVASSTNYRLQIDSINFSGRLSTSTNYTMEDTLGEVGTGTSTSASYNLSAGYQAMLGTTLSISVPANASLSSIAGNVGGQSSGSIAWTVITDSPAGYSLSIKASTDPALQSAASSFGDYTIAGAVPDYTWSILSTAAEFGFSPEGTHIVSRYLDNGANCGTGSSETADRCWDAFSTSNRQIAGSSSSNQPSGTVTTVRLLAEIGSAKGQTIGDYTAVITTTAIAL